MGIAIRLAGPLVVALVGCDHGGTRYELGKDASGRPLRLDKRTGDVAVIDGDTVIQLRDASTALAARLAQDAELAAHKSWGTTLMTTVGGAAELQTSWHDGKTYYAVTFAASPRSPTTEHVEKAPRGDSSAESRFNPSTFRRNTYTLILSDGPFDIAQHQLSLIGVTSPDGKTIDSFHARGDIPMSRETYKRLNGWNVAWREPSKSIF